MKKITFFLCALMLCLSASSAPVLTGFQKMSKDDFAKQQVLKADIDKKAPAVRMAMKAPTAKMETYDVTIVDCEGTNWGTDIQYIMNDADGMYRFAFDIFLPTGQEDVTLGQTYTLTDMDTEYTWGGNPTTEEQFPDFTAVTFVKTMNDGLVNITVNVTDEEGNIYNIVYQEEPLTEVVTQNYYIKNNWGGGSNEWTWQQMVAYDAESTYWTYTGVFGGTGVNINTAPTDEGASWFAVDAFVYPDLGYEAQAGDTIQLVYDPADTTLFVMLIGRPEVEPQPVVNYYIKNNWGGGANEWTWQSMALTSDGSWTYTGVFGIYGVNINTTMDDGGSLWFAIEDMNLTDPTMVPQEYDTVMFVYNTASTSITATVIGRYVQANNTCADVNAITGNTDMTLGEVTVVFAKGSNVYVMDETATTMVYSSVYANVVQAGNRVNGISGQARLYYTLPEFVPSTPVENLTIVSGEAPTIVDATSVPTAADVNRVMWFRNVVMPAESFTNSRISTINGTFLGETIAFRNNWKDAYTFDATKKYDMLGCVAIYNGVVQVYVTDFTEVVTQNYYIKNNWNAIGDWTWGQMTPSTDSTTWTYTGIFGGLGVNINMVADDTDALWFPVADMILTDATMTPQEFDTVLFTYTPASSSLSATVVGRPESLPYYVIGDYNDWSLETAVAMNTTDGVNYTTQISSLWGTFKILPARNWTHGEYVGTTENCTCAVGQTIALNLVPNGFGPSNDIHALNRYSNAVLSFSVNNNTSQLTLVSGTAQYGTYYIVGEFNNWNAYNAVEMTTTDGTNYYVHLDSLWGEFKITTAKDWNHQDWGASYSDDIFSYNSYNGEYRMSLRNNSDPEYNPNHNIHTDMGYSDVTLKLYVNYNNRYLSFESVAPFVGYSFVDNNIKYQITSQNPYTVAITRNSISTSTDLVIPDEVTFNGQNYAVTSIKNNAFYDNSYIKSVVIGDNVKTIEYQAFRYCNNLKSVTISESVTQIGNPAFSSCNNLKSVTWNAIRCNAYSSGPFYGCNSITSFVFGNNVQMIPDYLCNGLTSLTSITIPNSVTEIGHYAFYNTGLVSIVVPENIQSTGNRAFGYCTNLQSVVWNAINCTTYDDGQYVYPPFQESPNITSFTIGNGVQIIPNGLCYGMMITEIEIPNTVDTIGVSAFRECSALTTINIPNSVTSIGGSAFRECSALTTMNIPNSVTSIGGSAFYSCNNLNAITISENVTEINNYMFYGCSSLTSLSIPENVQAIGYQAFANCSNLSSILIPQNVSYLVDNAFSGCNNLTSVTWNAQNCAVGNQNDYNYDESGNRIYYWRDAISSPFPSSVQTITFGNQVQIIPAYLCYNMSGVTSVTIPNSVIRINNNAFRNCTNLASINLSNNLDYIGSKAFVNSGLMSVMIPESLDTIVSDAFYYYDYDNNDNNSNLSLVIWNARNCANVSYSQNWNSQKQEYEYSYYETTSSPFPSSVETFIFGDNVQKVPSGLCSGLNQLTSIALPNTVRTIGNNAFSGCSGLISFTMENGVQTIGNSAFYSCSNLPQIVMPNTVTKIGNNAFSSCRNLTTAIVGNSVDTIGGSAFSSCERLISIELPTTVNYIGGSAFYNCTSMNKAIIRSTAELDPYCMLLLNPQIDTIIAPASIFDIDEQHRLNYVCTKRMKYVKANSGELTEDAFVVIRRSASTLETLDVSATTNTTIADEAFSNMYRLIALGLPQGLDRISYKAVAECVRLQSIDIPAGITEIGDRAFEDCRSLTTITFGGQSGATADVALQTIGNWAFYNNHALQQLTIPAGVTTIGAGAFYGCTYLEDLAMPASLRNVGDNAFALCNHLTKMQVEADLPPMVAARTFFDVSRNIPVYVPDEAVNDYRNTAIWQEFFIRPISQAATGIETVRENDSDSQDEMLPDGKFMEDGRLLIRRNGKTYDAQGRLIR